MDTITGGFDIRPNPRNDMSVSCPVGFQAYDLARSASEISSYFRLPNNGVLKMDRSKLRFKNPWHLLPEWRAAALSLRCQCWL